ncbi:hypothetical protein V6N12_006730 [Hibiscus sabdariffa]|uniref:Myb/SANT-like domain-containing protein n=1 Tax=Hibiscus sabdariffa TaxID=183260 RepID=A0ABR2EZQ8_9ROSI
MELLNGIHVGLRGKNLIIFKIGFKMRSIMHGEASGKKVKAIWDRRLTIVFCDLCIKEILNGNRPGTHFKKVGWVKIVNSFENETGNPYTQKQLKNRWDLLKKEWKVWKKLKENHTDLGWNPTKGTIDASEEWWENRLKVVPEAQRFKLVGIDPELEDKLDQMFKGTVAMGDKAWVPSSGCDGNNESPEIQSQPIELVSQKCRSTEAGSSYIKTGKRKSSKQVKGASKLSMQIDKLCSATDNTSPDTSLTPDMDPFGIPQAVKILGELSEEVIETSELYFFALKLITNKDKRTVFLSIPPRVRVWWLKREMDESSKLSSLGT